MKTKLAWARRRAAKKDSERMMAAQRSRELSVGGEVTVDRDNDKNPVIALREIAEETVPLDELETAVIEGLQRNIDVDELAEEDDDMNEVTDVLTELTGLADDAETVATDPTAVKDPPTGDPMAALSAGFEDVVIEDAKTEV